MGNKLLLMGGGEELGFFCPGCEQYHSFRFRRIETKDGPLWRWNYMNEKPTFSPSLLVNGATEKRCHLYVREGLILYLDDCWHGLRSQRVAMKEEEADPQVLALLPVMA